MRDDVEWWLGGGTEGFDVALGAGEWCWRSCGAWRDYMMAYERRRSWPADMLCIDGVSATDTLVDAEYNLPMDKIYLNVKLYVVHCISSHDEAFVQAPPQCIFPGVLTGP